MQDAVDFKACKRRVVGKKGIGSLIGVSYTGYMKQIRGEWLIMRTADAPKVECKGGRRNHH